MSKLKVVAVVCKDGDDFLRWKKMFLDLGNKHVTLIDTIRKFTIEGKIFFGIYKTIHLCSLAIDDVVYTSECHLNPEYEEILELLKCNFNEPSEEKEHEIDKTVFRRWGLIDEQKNLFGNVNCQNLIDPVTCGREPSCAVCSRYLGWTVSTEKKELTENDIYNILHVAFKNVDCSVGVLMQAAEKIKKRL